MSSPRRSRCTTSCSRAAASRSGSAPSRRSPAPTRSSRRGAGDGVYKSVDGGANWKLASFGADITGRVVADPSRPGVVYEGRAGSVNSYFLKKTVDGGASWHNLAQGDRQFGFQYVYSFALD